MNLLALTHPDLVFINPPQRTPEAVIRWLTEPLAVRNVINDREAFIESVLQRESEGPTALVKRSPSRTVKPRRCNRRHFVWRSLTIRYAGRGWRVMKR